ncbi:MAG: vitamin K epoxide reductase family protein [Mycobacteriales bacterium]
MTRTAKPRASPAGPAVADVRPGSGGVGRTGSPYAESVSDALRRLASPDLTRRRRTAGLGLLSIGALGVVTAYQVGLLKHVPEPPGSYLDADRVDASGEAYQLLGTPDGALGIASYAATVALAAMGAADRATTQPWIPLLAAAKAGLDLVSGGYLFAEQITKHQKLCGWCTVAAAASVVAFPQTLPEARRALATLRGGGGR